MMTSSRKRGIQSVILDEINLNLFEPAKKRGSAVKASESIKNQTKSMAPRGLSKLPARSDSTPTMQDPSTPSDSLTLSKTLKSRPEVLCEGQKSLSKYIERNTMHTMQKAIALNIFAVSVSEGHPILDACKLAGKCTSFHPRVIRRWAEMIFRDFFAEIANIDDVTDDRLERELSSNRGKHPKWISLMHDEDFRLEATQYIRGHGYVKGAPNLTLAEFVHWVAEEWKVEVCEETV
jgi:hypothetical protein